MNKKSEELISRLQLTPHPEGGYYKEIYRSSNNVSSSKGKRSSLTSIYYLLSKNQVSCLHKVSSDEVWQFVEGDPLILVDLSSDLKTCNTKTLGALSEGLTPNHVIQSEHWQGAKCTGEYTLVSCFVAPGFEFEDFKLIHDDPKALSEITLNYPDLKEFLTK